MNEILPSAATWMDLEGITLSEKDQTENTAGYHLHVESKKHNKLVNIITTTKRLKEQTNGYQ